MPNYIRGEGPLGNVRVELMVIAEAPGAVEEQYGRPLIGPTGELFDELCEAAGISRSELYITNVVKYRPPNNDFSRLHEIGVDLLEQTTKLWEEIRRVQPNCILALGDKALQATTGKTGIHNYRGSILKSKDNQYKVVSTFHPANLLYQKARNKGKGLFKYAWKYVMIADFRRALEQSKFKEYKVPQRELKIARNSHDLYKFIKRHDHLHVRVTDIESINCVPVCIGLAYNGYEAISVPLYSKFAKARISDSSHIDLCERWQLLADELGKNGLVGQNLKYDDEKCYRVGLQFGDLHSDTLLLEHTLNPELPSKKLHVISSIRTEEPYYKEEGKEFRLGKDDIDQLFLYNARDCVTTFDVHVDQEKELLELAELYSPKVVDFYYGFVRKLHKFYLEMERVGFKVDLEKRKQLLKKYTDWNNGFQEEFVKLVGHPVNVMSPKQLNILLYDEMHCPFRLGTGQKAIVGLLTNVIQDEPRKKVLNNILDNRRVRKAKSFIGGKADYDGRMRSSYFITGTETGRSSTNVLKPPIRPERIGWTFHGIPMHGDIGPDVKEMLVPDEGYVFLHVDLSQAEANIVCVLAEDWDLLNVIQSKAVDIHRRTAGLAFGMIKTMELGAKCSNALVDLIGKDSGERFVGKKTRHAGNYDMGPETFHQSVMQEARRFGIQLDFSEYRAKVALESFHEASPKIRGIFHRDIREVVGKTRVLVNPYGRVRMFMDRSGDAMYREAFAFIPQSTVHDTLLLGGIRIKDKIPELRFVKESHDAFTVLAPKAEAEDIARVMKKELSIEIDFNYGSIKRDFKLVIGTDFELFEHNYKEGVKLKL